MAGGGAVPNSQKHPPAALTPAAAAERRGPLGQVGCAAERAKGRRVKGSKQKARCTSGEATEKALSEGQASPQTPPFPV